MLTDEQVNALGQILDTTWGRPSSTGAATMSVKAKLSGEKLTVTFSCYATFASDRTMSSQIPALKDQGEKATDRYMKSVKEQYKKETGEALKTKLINSNPSTEIISLQSHISPKRTVLFRLVSVFKMD